MARTDAEWAREVERRLAALERPRIARCGAWTLSETASGGLEAVNSRTGRAVRIAPDETT